MNATTPPRSQTDLQAAIIRHPLIVSPDTPVMEAIAQMSEMQAMDTSTQSADAILSDRHRDVRSSCVLVVDEGHLVGILSERDIVRLLAQQQSLENLVVRQAMTGSVVSLRESAATDLCSVMTLLQQQTQPVALLDDHGQIVGLLTLGGFLEQRVAQLEAEQVTLLNQYTAELEQQTVEKKLIDHERLYQRIIQAQTDLILRSLPDTTITFANDAFCVALGRSPEDVIGLQWSSFVPPEDLDALPHKIAALTPANPSFANINRDYRANNQIGWTQWITLGIFDEREALVAIQSVGRDITGLQQQIQREQALSQVIQSIRNSLDLDAIFAIATAATAQLLDGLNCFVVKYLPEQGVWRHVAESHDDPETPSTIGFEIPDAGNPFADQLKQLQLVCVESTASLDDAINHDVAQTIPGAWLLIPLVIDGSVWGSFTITTTQQPFVWSDDQIELAQAITNQLEIAIFQANLYQQVQQELEERCQVEVALRESETRFRNMAANVPGAIFRYLLRPDGSDGVVYMSPGCYGLWEMEAQAVEANAALLWQVIDLEDLPGMQASVLKSARTLQPWVWTWRITTPSGRRKWLEASGIPTMQANGDVIWDTLIMDVSDRKQFEIDLNQLNQELQASERKFRAIFNNVFQFVGLLTLDGILLETNQTALNFGGFKLEDVINRPFWECYWWTISAATQTQLQQAIARAAQGEFVRYEVDVLGVGDRVATIDFSLRPLKDESGTVVLLIPEGRDITEAKRNEAILKQAEKLRLELTLLENILDVILAGYWDWDLQTNQEYLSPGFKRMLGYADHELPNTPESWQCLIFPDDLPNVLNCFDRHVQSHGEVPFYNEVRYHHKDGSTVWVICSGQVIEWDAANKALRMIGCHINITQRKQAEEQLQKSDAHLKAAQRIGKLGSWEFDPPTGHVTWSDEVFRIFGRDLELGAPSFEELQQQIYAGDRDNHQDVLQTAIETVQPYEIEYRLYRPDGTLRHVQARGEPLVDASGQLVQLVGTVLDITDRKQAEENLRNLSDRLTLALKSGAIGIWDWHIPDNSLIWDDRMYELFGITPDQFTNIYDDWANRLHPDDRASSIAANHLALQGKKDYDHEFRVVHPDGTIRFIKAYALVQRNEQGEPQSMIGINFDITERKQAELKLQQTTAQLEASNRELEAFAYSVSHDLRSPLRAIDGFSRALLEDYGEHFDEESKDYFDRIRSNVNRMGMLIDDLLRLSRVSRSEMRYGSVNLSALVQAQVDDMQAAEPERQVTVVVAPGAIVSADATLMGVAIANLLQNAWKFTSHHATAHLEFGVIQQAGQPAYFVRDDGAGFDMAYANMLFGVFQRLHNTDEFPGTGIGLATVQRAIHRHGGRVWAEGAVEQGATIYFTVPHTPIGIGG